MDMDSKFQCDQFLVVCMIYSFSSNSFNFLSFDYVINFSLPALLRAENQKNTKNLKETNCLGWGSGFSPTLLMMVI